MIEPFVTEPGVWDIPIEIYKMDQCCDRPSLNAGCVNDMLDECPAIAWQRHPRLNPEYEPVYKTHFDIGSATHLIFLEPDDFDDRTSVVNASDWKADWAQRERRAARDAGKIPLLVNEWTMIHGMNAALMENASIRQAFAESISERSVFAKDPETGIWRRCRPDKIASHGGWLLDYKAMESANPNDFPRQAWQWKWHRRAPWYLDTFRFATGADPQEYWFVVQSKQKPYLATIQSLDFVSIDKGRRDCEEASRRFAECLNRGLDFASWPIYSSPGQTEAGQAFRSTLPPFAHQQIDWQHQQWDDAKAKAARDLAQSPLEA